jgi:DNA sulfur modification protein DndC
MNNALNMHLSGGAMEQKVKVVQMQHRSAFCEIGLEEAIRRLITKTKELYLSDSIPWVIGYSGGKDSTATLQLIWTAIRGLPEEKRTKPVHVISTDTLVENPIVAKWVEHSLDAMRAAAASQGVNIEPHRLLPALQDRFWVNLIGRGYPAPRPMFRWCTSRLKINPSNKFISELAEQNGEAILVLGSRKQESAARKTVLERYEGSTRDLLSRNNNPKLDRVWVYTPIDSWSNDDVWEYLVSEPNPWGYNNRDLLAIYRGATADNECPLVVDTSTPSCGDSRFGCFVCTLVDKDKSMQAMIKNDEEKQWMLPLSEFRNKFLDVKEDWAHRDFRRMDRSLVIHKEGLLHGPYKQRYRKQLLLELLKAQRVVQETGPEHVSSLELISLDELEEIRRIWVKEKHEFEDCLPGIYEEALGKPYPKSEFDEGQVIAPEDVEMLRKVAASPEDPDELHFQLVRELLHIEQGYRTASRRAGIYDAFEKTLEGSAFDSEQEAYEFALERARLMKEAQGPVTAGTPPTSPETREESTGLPGASL